MQQLLKWNDIEAGSQNNHNETPLIYIVVMGRNKLYRSCRSMISQLIHETVLTEHHYLILHGMGLSQLCNSCWGKKIYIFVVSAGSRDNSGKTPLSHAVERGRCSFLFALLKNPVSSTVSSCTSPRTSLILIQTCWKGQRYVLHLLINE